MGWELGPAVCMCSSAPLATPSAACAPAVPSPPPACAPQPHLVALAQQVDLLCALVRELGAELAEGLELVQELVHHVPQPRHRQLHVDVAVQDDAKQLAVVVPWGGGGEGATRSGHQPRGTAHAAQLGRGVAAVGVALLPCKGEKESGSGAGRQARAARPLTSSRSARAAPAASWQTGAGSRAPAACGWGWAGLGDAGRPGGAGGAAGGGGAAHGCSRFAGAAGENLTHALLARCWRGAVGVPCACCVAVHAAALGSSPTPPPPHLVQQAEHVVLVHQVGDQLRRRPWPGLEVAL